MNPNDAMIRLIIWPFHWAKKRDKNERGNLSSSDTNPEEIFVTISENLSVVTIDTSGSEEYPYQCRCGILVITTAQLQSTKPELRFCTDSNPAHSMSEIGDSEDLWQWARLEIRVNVFRQSTVPQKQFIITQCYAVFESTTAKKM